MPRYLNSYLTFPSKENYLLRLALTNKINFIPSRTKSFKKTFFPCCINEWNNSNAEVTNTKSVIIFKTMIVTEKKKKENSLFSVNDSLGVKFLTRLRLYFSHLNKHEFRHLDTVRPICGCNAKIEDVEYFLLCCYFYSIQRFELFNNINKVDLSCAQLDTEEQVKILCTVIHQTNLMPWIKTLSNL